MIQFWYFATEYPVIALLLAYVVIRYSFRFYRQTVRSLTIMIHGYPPMWCDADGDFPKPVKSAKAAKDTE